MRGSLLVVLAGCASTPHPTYDRLDARIPALVATVTDLANDVDAAVDCRHVAARLRRFSWEHASELGELEELRARMSPSEREHLDFEHDGDERRLAAAFHTVSTTCAGEPDVDAARALAGFR